MARDEKNNGGGKKSSGLLMACWFLLLLILLILFFVKKDLITANLEKTDFFGKVFGSSTVQTNSKNDNKNKIAKEFAENTENAENAPFSFDLNTKKSPQEEVKVYQEATGSESVKAMQEDALIISQNNERTAETERSVIAGKKASSEYTSSEYKRDIQGAKTETGEKTGKNTAESEKAHNPKETNAQNIVISPAQTSQKAETKITAPQKVAEREATLFFVAIAPDGSVSRKPVKRMLPKSDSPLTDSINALLAGPLPSERGKNCMSLIPEGSKLLGASIKNGIATLDFNEQFEFNGLGVEGYVAQLMQIVYTSTEFSTVSSVQFLIEGKRREYLGSEGQWIGTPLSRNSF